MDLHRLSMFGLALASAFGTALVAFPALRLERRRRTAVLAVVGVTIALSPLWIPGEAALLRLLAAMNATALLVKIYDLHVAAGRWPQPGFSEFVGFLPNWFSVVWRRLGAEPKPTPRQNLLRLVQALWKTAAAVAVVVWLCHLEWSRAGFFLEHCVKTTAFFGALIPVTDLGISLWRLAGGRGRDFMNAPLLAATPGQFWRRYNRPAQQFLYEDVYLRTGGFRSPVRATLATFAVSAVVHEYVFGVTLGRVQGYQTVFFLLQGLGVAATLRVRPRKPRAWAWIVATFVFNLATSVFFFVSLNGVFPFYSNELPRWLAGW